MKAAFFNGRPLPYSGGASISGALDWWAFGV